MVCVFFLVSRRIQRSLLSRGSLCLDWGIEINFILRGFLPFYLYYCYIQLKLLNILWAGYWAWDGGQDISSVHVGLEVRWPSNKRSCERVRVTAVISARGVTSVQGLCEVEGFLRDRHGLSDLNGRDQPCVAAPDLGRTQHVLGIQGSPGWLLLQATWLKRSSGPGYEGHVASVCYAGAAGSSVGKCHGALIGLDLCLKGHRDHCVQNWLEQQSNSD